MPIGPGKYDHVCTLVRTATQARAALVIVIDGEHGSGFSVQSDERLHPIRIADVLEQVARELRDSLKG